MMNPGLVLLIRLQLKAWFRRTFGDLRRPRNLVILVIGLGACAGWAAMLVHPGASPVGRADRVRIFAPTSMALLALLTSFASLRTRGIYFKPAEIDFLFPAPVSRRQLLLYRMLGQATGVLLSAAMIGILFGRHVPHRGFAIAGVALFFAFLTGFGYALSLLASTVNERVFARVGARVKVCFLLALAGVLAMLIVEVVRRPQAYQHAYRLLEAPPCSWLLSPFHLFAQAITAPRFYPEFVLHAGASLALCVAMFALVVGLDVDYREASVRSSQWIQERLQRVQRGAPALALSDSPRQPLSLPGPMYLDGVGPVFWRQLVGLVRNLKALVVPLVATLLITTSIVISLPGRMPAFEQGLSSMLLVTLFLTAWLRFDFRGDLDQIEALRSLPLPPWKVALGQMLTPVLALVMVQVTVLIGTLLAEREPMSTAQVVAILAGLPLIDVLLIAVENLAFLLFPVRHTPGQPADIQFLGRTVILLLMKTVAFALVAGLALACGRLAFVLSGSLGLAVCAAAAALAVADWLAVFLVGKAFARFDVARDRAL